MRHPQIICRGCWRRIHGPGHDLPAIHGRLGRVNARGADGRFVGRRAGHVIVQPWVLREA